MVRFQKLTRNLILTLHGHHAGASFLNRARNSRCTVITDLDTSNGAHRKPFPDATPSWKLAPRPHNKDEKRTAGSA